MRTKKTKKQAYRDGNYCFNVPPVETSHWDEDSWIKWISHWTATICETCTGDQCECEGATE